ncbi:hypothetical protein [uncultured Rikenella sp.]|uniref:hypothetical protein n=1 Tax=uncultured Rikenella sp. TaxID=368003 RepID=UPI0026160710|nr:hypothetical protein [uncultured Rikenella sp.]
MREFLKDLNLDQEVIDKIMKEMGTKIEDSKGKDEKITDLEAEIIQLKKDKKALKTENDKLNLTIEENNKSLENLQTITNENKNLKAEIQMSGSEVKKEFSKFVMSEVMSKVDDKTDFETALENYKKECPQYFGETVVKKVQSSPSVGTGENHQTTTNDIMNNILRGK